MIRKGNQPPVKPGTKAEARVVDAVTQPRRLTLITAQDIERINKSTDMAETYPMLAKRLGEDAVEAYNTNPLNS